eukprot:1157232-Pelagomonas_calceolata.AAC.5
MSPVHCLLGSCSREWVCTGWQLAVLTLSQRHAECMQGSDCIVERCMRAFTSQHVLASSCLGHCVSSVIIAGFSIHWAGSANYLVAWDTPRTYLEEDRDPDSMVPDSMVNKENISKVNHNNCVCLLTGREMLYSSSQALI